MTKRRSSLRGRGAEILFGSPRPVEIKPRGLDEELDEPVWPELPPLDEEPASDQPADKANQLEDEPLDAEFEKALSEEAQDAQAESKEAAVKLEPSEQTQNLESKPKEAEVKQAPLEEAPDAEPEPTDIGREPPDEEPIADSLADLLDEPALQFNDAELEKALYEEARDGEPGPGREEDLSVLEEPPPTPEMEEAFFEEAVVAEEPPEPVAEEPIPTTEETMEEIALSEESAMYEPPEAETSDVVSGVLPPRPAQGFFDMGSIDWGAAAADIQTVGEDVEFLELSDRELTKEEERILLRRMGTARIRELDEYITEMYHQVRLKVGDNPDIATECYNLLLKARDIVLRRDADRFPQAEYYIEQVHARLKRAQDSEKGAKKYAWWITAWGFLWGTIFLAGLILLNFDWVNQALTPASTTEPTLSTAVFLSSMIWGGIGGVVAVWYSLFKHVGLRDFDTQYVLSYIGKPFLGLVLGATVYMLFHLLLTLGILPAGLMQGDSAAVAVVTPWIMYPLAWASGFKENRIFDLVDRVIKRLFSGSRSEPEESSLPWEESAE